MMENQSMKQPRTSRIPIMIRMTTIGSKGSPVITLFM
jgi:hypothetical protein